MFVMGESTSNARDCYQDVGTCVSIATYSGGEIGWFHSTKKITAPLAENTIKIKHGQRDDRDDAIPNPGLSTNQSNQSIVLIFSYYHSGIPLFKWQM